MPKQKIVFEVQGAKYSEVLKRTSEIVEALEDTGNVVMIEVGSICVPMPSEGRASLYLTHYAKDRKLEAIKAVRHITGIALKEAKKGVEHLDMYGTPFLLAKGSRLDMEKALSMWMGVNLTLEVRDE